MTFPVPVSGGPVPSPCTSVCTMNAATGWCAGCFRTLDEIASWSVLDDDERRAVWNALDERRTASESSTAQANTSQTRAHAER